jgi:outer membrane usher protein
MGSVSRMAPKRTLSAALACVLALQAFGAPAAREGDLQLRIADFPLESPVGGHLAVREAVVDGRSLGWRELVEYRGTLDAPRALLDSLGLSLRPTEALLAVPAANGSPKVATPPTAPAVDLVAPALASPATATSPVMAQAAPARPSAPGRLLPLDVRVNGTKAGNWVLLEKDGALYATPDAFEEWRLSRDQTKQGIEYRDRVWYPLSSIPGYEAQFNFAEQSVDLKFRASEFGATRLGGYDTLRAPLSPVLTSFFVNYDVSQTSYAGRDFTTRRDLGALTELGFSGSLGVLTSSYVGRNLTEDENLEPRTWRRLETTFNRDFPDQNVTLRLGDSSTRQSMWGRQVYFGGIQIGRNYAFTPGFITYPLPILAGQSAAPSTVELYVNDVLRQTSQVPTGPFTIDNFPLLTGSGQARLVVRDLLGRETVLVQNFFSSAVLLDAGLSDWSAEIGAVRRNFGIENADYGQTFGSGLIRYGIDRQRTVEARAEVGEETQGGGVGLSMELPWQILGQVGLAGSRNDVIGNGGHAVFSLQHSSLRHGFTVSLKGSSPEYRQVGLEANPLLSRREYSAGYTSYAGGARGSFGVAYARIEQFDDTQIDTMSANYTLRIGARSSLTFTASRVTGIADANAIGASLLVPFENRISATANIVHREEGTDAFAGASQGLGAEIGVGWRALAGRRAGQNFGEGGLYYQGSKALLTADVNATSDQQTARLGVQGAFVAADGSLFATRKIQHSFAVVEVPGYENVGVGFQSSVFARTDASGRAIVPNLQPYRQNSIRLDPNELPISAELDSIEQTAVPAALSGVKVRFPVRPGRGALLKITLADGQPAPAGAVVAIKGDDKEFYVARRGEAFVTGLQPSNIVILKWHKQTCELKIDLPPGTADDIARVGPVVCAGVTR